jgi:hypothetical protein
MNTLHNRHAVLVGLEALLVLAACKKRQTSVEPNQQPEPPV